MQRGVSREMKSSENVVLKKPEGRNSTEKATEKLESEQQEVIDQQTRVVSNERNQYGGKCELMNERMIIMNDR